jgi:FdhD protein
MNRASPATRVRIRRFGQGGPTRERDDHVAGEEPLELRWRQGGDWSPLLVTMRTPGADFEFAAGFLLSEGIVAHRRDLQGISYCTDVDEAQQYNVVNVDLGDSARAPTAAELRHFAATASCGVCGKGQLEALTLQGCRPLPNGTSVRASVIASLPERLRAAQPLFDRTGGLHAAGLFDRDGTLLALREDVGRHNALDKVLGWALLEDRVPLADTLVCVSGRASYELAQKCVAAGAPLLAAVSAPSSLAIDVARRFGLALAGFVRGGGFNLYAGMERVLDDVTGVAEAVLQAGD